MKLNMKGGENIIQGFLNLIRDLDHFSKNNDKITSD